MDKQKVVRRTEDLAEAMSGMRAAMDQAKETIPERQLKITEFKKKYPDVLYIEPHPRIPTQGIKHPEMEKQRDYLWEYVTGIFESQIIVGKLEFFLTGLPGDDYCKWSIPVNKPVGVPRFVALHLSQQLGWKEMKPLGKGNMPREYHEEEMMEPFSQFEYKKRGHFHPLNAYS